jgi:hypothetical protein
LKSVLKRIPRPSPALVIACAALAVALGGVGYAATVIPRNSVGALQLKPNSVNSSKVLNGSLMRADFRAGQIPRGLAGPPGSAGPAGPAGATGPAGPAGPTNAGVSLAVKNVSDSGEKTTSSTSYEDLASTTIEVPSGNTATLVATFSAESACYNAASGTCGVKITVDGNEMNPTAGNDYDFDYSATGKSSSSHQGHALVRYQGNVGAGSHKVTIQYRASNSSVKFRIDDWALSVVAYKQ